jgi:hypothetical protein
MTWVEEIEHTVRKDDRLAVAAQARDKSNRISECQRRS